MMERYKTQKSICPHCQGLGDDFFEPCQEKACKTHGYYLVPTKYLSWTASRQNKETDSKVGLVLDRYLLVKKLGAGGMGAVYLSLQKPLMREVAIKLLTQVNMTQEVEERFFREAKAMSLLGHPNVIRLHDFSVVDIQGQPTPLMVMEYLKGGRTLRAWFDEKRKKHEGISLDDVDSLFSQILTGLHAAHKLGLIHRDIKPENIMVVPIEGNPTHVKILDFGLAKAMENMDGFNTDLSRTGSFLGTPHYMAPEQTMFSSNDTVVGPQSDLYAVGVILFETFAGVRPFTGANYREIIWNKVNKDFDPFMAPETADWSPKLEAFLKKAMSIDPKDRFTDALDMLTQLHGVLADSDNRTAPVGLLPTRVPGSSRAVHEAATRVGPANETEIFTEEPKYAHKKTGKRLIFVAIAIAAILAIAMVFSGMRKKGGDTVEKPGNTKSSVALPHAITSVPVKSRTISGKLEIMGPRPIAPVFTSLTPGKRLPHKKAGRIKDTLTRPHKTGHLWKTLNGSLKNKPGYKKKNDAGPWL